MFVPNAVQGYTQLGAIFGIACDVCPQLQPYEPEHRIVLMYADCDRLCMALVKFCEKITRGYS